MSRIANAILPSGQAWAKGRQNPMLDLTYGGQLGYAPEYTEWVSNQAYIRRNLIPILLEAPAGFKKMDNPDKWVSTLRSLVERHALSIDGLAAGLEVEVVDSGPVGGGGEQHQDFVNVTRARSNPVIRWTEKYGMPIQAFLRNWITMLMMDPDSKVANIGTLASGRPTDMLADMYTMSMLFIEPDPTHSKVVKSFLCSNMMPQNSGEFVGRRDLTAAGEITTYDIPFTAITQTGLGVDAFAQQILDSISIVNANPYLRPAFIQSISADVAAQSVGYAAQTQNLGNTALRV